jgi:hypothetical protein
MGGLEGSCPQERRSSMQYTGPGGIKGIFGLNGTPLDLTTLPSSQTVRWVMRRKAEVVTAVCYGLLNVDDACKRYGISMEEFFTWKNAMDRFGPVGLRASRLRQQKSVSNSRDKKRKKQCVV